jgi:hypothetical protein
VRIQAALALLSLFALALAPPAASAPAARCGALTGKRLVHSPSIRVVERDRDESRGYVYICVPPSGRVHLAGWAFDETGASLFSVSVDGSAGTWVALTFHSQVDPHGGEEVDKMCNAASGRCYRFYEAPVREGPGFEEEPSEYWALEGLAVNRYGQLLLALSLQGTTRIVGVQANGARRTLDTAPEASIPPTSLKLNGHSASWTDAGAVRTATL